MIDRKSTFFIGLLIFLLPFLGIPNTWKSFFMVGVSIVLVISSIKISFPVRSTKSKIKKDKIKELGSDVVPVYPRDNIVDINPEVPVIRNLSKPERKKTVRRTKNADIK
ncbi:MAG: hypothetical protein WAW92_03285 [Minisyncoccia bacterium]